MRPKKGSCCFFNSFYREAFHSAAKQCPCTQFSARTRSFDVLKIPTAASQIFMSQGRLIFSRRYATSNTCLHTQKNNLERDRGKKVFFHQLIGFLRRAMLPVFWNRTWLNGGKCNTPSCRCRMLKLETRQTSLASLVSPFPRAGPADSSHCLVIAPRTKAQV